MSGETWRIASRTASAVAATTATEDVNTACVAHVTVVSAAASTVGAIFRHRVPRTAPLDGRLRGESAAEHTSGGSTADRGHTVSSKHVQTTGKERQTADRPVDHALDDIGLPVIWSTPQAEETKLAFRQRSC